jgi:hypothetical protein
MRQAEGLASPDLWRINTLAALHSTYPQLFGTPPIFGSVRVAMVLNSDGTVYKSTIESSWTSDDDADLLEQLRHQLGVSSAELEVAPRQLVFAPSTEHPSTILVALGIHKSDVEATSAR